MSSEPKIGGREPILVELAVRVEASVSRPLVERDQMTSTMRSPASSD